MITIRLIITHFMSHKLKAVLIHCLLINNIFVMFFDTFKHYTIVKIVHNYYCLLFVTQKIFNLNIISWWKTYFSKLMPSLKYLTL